MGYYTTARMIPVNSRKRLTTTVSVQRLQARSAARDQFVLSKRGSRPDHDPWRYQGLVVEDERAENGDTARSATVFLTGRECPWRCTMCDLWQYTTIHDTPPGAVPSQLGSAWRALDDQREPVTQMKLYNAGSFFDPRAVPESDYRAIADLVQPLTRVIVESHPSLIGPRVEGFLVALGGTPPVGRQPPTLEVAMGLETSHPAALDCLNKRMTVDSFRRAADILVRLDVALRVFLLVAPPFVPADDQDLWLRRSVDVAFAAGASVVSLIPTRTGNGALDALAEAGRFCEPRLSDIERALDIAVETKPAGSRVFVDLWDLERFSDCRECFEGRRARLHAINLEQVAHPMPPACLACATGA